MPAFFCKDRLAFLAGPPKLESLASLDEGRGQARGGLEAADDHIDIERIELDPRQTGRSSRRP